MGVGVSTQLGENLRWRCWLAENLESQTRDRTAWSGHPMRWPKRVAAWLRWTEDTRRAEQLLTGTVSPSEAEIAALADALRIDEQDLIFSRLAEANRQDFSRLNLARLLVTSDGQTKAQLAEALGIHQSTFSRWIDGQKPDRRARRALREHFGLRSELDVLDEPIFLSYWPITHTERVHWVQSQARGLHPSQMRDLFPALAKLLTG